MNQIFEKTSIAGMVLENRIIRSGAHEGMGLDDGRPDNELLTIYERLAKNQVGAILRELGQYSIMAESSPIPAFLTPTFS